MKIQQMRQRITNDWEDTNVLPVALRILDTLLEEYDDLQEVPLDISSYHTSVDHASREEINDVIKVFNYFCHPYIGILRPYYELHNCGIHEVTADELHEAEQDGYLPHPTTGQPIYDYESYVTVSFIMNPDFFEQAAEIY